VRARKTAEKIHGL